MPGVSGVTVVTMLVCFFILHARLRAHRAPGIPCALWCFRRANREVKLGRFTPRDRGGVAVRQLSRESAVVMAGRGDEALLRADVPAIHVFLAVAKPGRGSPGQAR